MSKKPQSIAPEPTAPQPIIINPNINSDAQCFEKNEFIHATELDRVIKIIENLKERSKNYHPDNNKEFRREHNTITLSGNRGSGKTSFLMSLRRAKEIKEDVFFLIDPTLTEEKGHIFLNIISRIKEELNKVFKGKNLIEDEDYKTWNKYLKNLAAGMPLLDGVGANLDSSDWYDSTFVMEKGLHNIESANNLEQNFHIFIKKSLEILGKEKGKEIVFIIAFDDVDTDFAKGWPVMETIRKYLTSPQLVIILSGDLDLYSLLVRKKQWKNFGKALLINESDNKDSDYNEYVGLVSRLENQYLVKVLKPENRIILSPLLKKINLNTIPFQVRENGSAISVRKYYAKFLETLGIASYIAIETYYPFLASMPIRSQMSLMRAFERYKDDKSEEGFIQGVIDIFYTDLKTSNVEVWDMVNGIGFINVHILKFLIDNKLLDEGSQLLPKTGKDELNGALIALGVIWRNRIFSKPAEIFDYIIRISSVVNLAEKWGYENKDGINIDNFIKHSRVYHDYGLKKISSLQAAYIDTFLESTNDAPTFGFIPLKALYSITKKRTAPDTWRLDDIFNLDNKSTVLDYLGYLPAFNATGSLNTNRIYYSFNNILAATGELMLVNDENVLDEFIKLTQFREFQRWQKGISLAIRGKRDNEEGEDITTNNEPDIIDSEISGLTDFINSFTTWRNKYNKIEIPPYLLGRIMVRTYYSFLRIDDKIPVAEQLHRQFICFFNAILVEEYMEKKTAKGLTLANPTGRDDIFLKNLRFTIPEKVNLQLFNMIIQCPLINIFADLSILSNIAEYDTLFNKNININIQLRKLDEIIEKKEIHPILQIENTPDNDFVILDDVPIERASYKFWETPENAKIIAKYAMRNNYPKEEFVKDFHLLKRVIKELFATAKLYEKRITGLRKILTNTNYKLNGIEWT